MTSRENPALDSFGFLQFMKTYVRQILKKWTKIKSSNPEEVQLPLNITAFPFKEYKKKTKKDILKYIYTVYD